MFCSDWCGGRWEQSLQLGDFPQYPSFAANACIQVVRISGFASNVKYLMYCVIYRFYIDIPSNVFMLGKLGNLGAPKEVLVFQGKVPNLEGSYTLRKVHLSPRFQSSPISLGFTSYLSFSVNLSACDAPYSSHTMA